MRLDRNKTLDQLERQTWPPPGDVSHLITTLHRLRTKPIGEFTVEELRIAIGQNVGLEFLVPLALEVVEQNPLAEGDFYPGDLLKSLLGAEKTFWADHADLRVRLESVVSRIPEAPKAIRDGIQRFRGGR